MLQIHEIQKMNIQKLRNSFRAIANRRRLHR